MDDIVECLRDWSERTEIKSNTIRGLFRAAADQIEMARKEVDLKGYRLDDALDEIKQLRAEIAAMRRNAITRMISISEQAGLYDPYDDVSNLRRSPIGTVHSTPNKATEYSYNTIPLFASENYDTGETYE